MTEGLASVVYNPNTPTTAEEMPYDQLPLIMEGPNSKIQAHAKTEESPFATHTPTNTEGSSTYYSLSQSSQLLNKPKSRDINYVNLGLVSQRKGVYKPLPPLPSQIPLHSPPPIPPKTYKGVTSDDRDSSGTQICPQSDHHGVRKGIEMYHNCP